MSTPAWIDPQMRRILEDASAADDVPVETLPVAEARRRSREAMAPWDEVPPGGRTPEATALGGRPASLYPATRVGRGTILYLHGGGWVLGGLDTHGAIMGALAQASGWRLIGLDYRLAPEHPFPAALEDVDEALADLEAEHGAGPIVLAGDSAGANLALGAAAGRRGGSIGPAALLLFYGAYRAPGADSTSARLFGGGGFALSNQQMRWYWRHYAGRASGDALRGRACEFAELEGLPPTFLCAAGLDPLRDDSRDLADRLLEAGVATSFVEYPGVIHGFLRYLRRLDAARRCVREAAAWLEEALPQAGPEAVEG